MNDHDLVRQVLQGNRRAFEMLVEQHQRLVSHMVGRIVNRAEDHEELCQDVFLRVYDQLSEFKHQSKLSTWIATIAYRMSINFVKKKELKISEEEVEVIIDKQLQDDNSPLKLLASKDSASFLNELILLLPVHYRTVLTLFHLQEMSYPEIVEITGLPEGTVKNYLFRGRKILKEKLEYFLSKEVL